jgi:hypothetical protein
MDPVLQGLAKQFEAETRNEAALHYVIYRKTGGFGPKVAATLAASMVLQKFIADASRKPEEIDSCVKYHRHLVHFLMNDAEPKLAFFDAMFQGEVS